MGLVVNGKAYLSEDIAVTDDVTVGDDIVLSGGGDIKSTNNGTICILPNGTGITQIGDAGSTSHTLAANNDLFVSGKLEVDGAAYFDGGSLTMSNDADFIVGSFAAVWKTSQTVPTILAGVDGTSRTILVAEIADRNFDFSHAGQSNPTIFIHSANQSTTEWISFTHNQTDAVEGVGVGGHITNHGSPVTLADDASFDLPDASAGFGFFMAGDGEEYAQVSWTSAGVVTLINNSANVASTDSDTDFCIFDNGTAVRVRNRLGASKTVTFDYHYTTP